MGRMIRAMVRVEESKVPLSFPHTAPSIAAAYVCRMKRLGMQILTQVVLLYSVSPLVIWTLYTFEKHDIVLFYTTACDTSNGASFVHAIEDASKGFHGACSVVKIAESTQSTEPLCSDCLRACVPSPHRFTMQPIGSFRSLQLHSIFHPPRTCRA
ncbi:MAG: hypothetical protein RL156_930 [Bacteroidota bacterium]